MSELVCACVRACVRACVHVVVFVCVSYALHLLLLGSCYAVHINALSINLKCTGQFCGDGRTVRTLLFGVYKLLCITGSYLWLIQKYITL